MVGYLSSARREVFFYLEAFPVERVEQICELNAYDCDEIWRDLCWHNGVD